MKSDWNELFQNRTTDLPSWPWSDLVTLFYGYCRNDSKSLNVLELGFAGGANIPFFERIGCAYTGLEGAASAVQVARDRFPHLVEKLHHIDFREIENFSVENKFNLVVDRSSLTHNRETDISHILKDLDKSIRKGTIFIGIDWHSKSSDSYEKYKTDTCDYLTFAGDTQFKGVEGTLFTDEAKIRSIFKNYTIVHLEEKISQNILSGEKRAWYNFVGIRN